MTGVIEEMIQPRRSWSCRTSISSSPLTGASTNVISLFPRRRGMNWALHAKSCSYIDGSGENYEVEPNDVEVSKSDILAPLSGKLIDGINQNEARRRALMLLCLVHFNVNARDALMLSADSKGFDVLAKVHGAAKESGVVNQQNQWNEFRFTFKEAVPNIQVFCSMLVDMEEEALKYVKSISGIS